MRSDRKIASSTSWVMNSTVMRKRCHMLVRICCITLRAWASSAPARRARDRHRQGLGLYEIRRVLVLHAVRGRLPDRRGDGQYPLPVALRGPSVDPFDSPELDLDEIAVRLADGDSQIRRVAVMALGEAADPAAVPLLDR